MRSASGCHLHKSHSSEVYERDDAISFTGRQECSSLFGKNLDNFNFISIRRRVTAAQGRQEKNIYRSMEEAHRSHRRCNWGSVRSCHRFSWLPLKGIPVTVFGSINTDFSHLRTWCYHWKALTPAPRTLLTQKLSFYCNWFSHPEERDKHSKYVENTDSMQHLLQNLLDGNCCCGWETKEWKSSREAKMWLEIIIITIIGIKHLITII